MHLLKSINFIGIKRFFLLVSFLLTSVFLSAQGYNHNFLLGYTTGVDSNVISKRGWLKFDNNSIAVIPDNFNMSFRAAQGNISDINGNLLMVSNGCYIMNANGDTMMNGSGLNPGSFTNSWCQPTLGIPYPHSNVVLPWPDDSTKYVLFHLTGNHNLSNPHATELYYSKIDMTLDNGLGGVISGQKNVIAIQDTLKVILATCKHANGRDWWIIIFEDDTDILYKLLLTPQGIISITTQSIGMSPNSTSSALGQAKFSPDGKKFAYHHRDFGPNGQPVYHEIRLFDFNRCTGDLSNGSIISLTDNVSGNGLAFSSNSKYLYFTLFDKVFQINIDTIDIQSSLQLVAINDGYCYPFNFTCTDFWFMYLAANGKIYISSGNGVVDMHYIDSPDSGGIACNVQQHALPLPCWSGRGNVYHPNYYLGCDTTCTPCLVSIDEVEHDFRFNIYPNPSTGNFNIIYLLPQNKEGKLKVLDITGKIVYEMRLPQWSTLQQISLPKNMSNGIYSAIIRSENSIATKKFVLLRE